MATKKKQVEQDTNDAMENPATTDEAGDADPQDIAPDEPIERFEYGLSGAFFRKEYTTEKI